MNSPVRRSFIVFLWVVFFVGGEGRQGLAYISGTVQMKEVPAESYSCFIAGSLLQYLLI